MTALESLLSAMDSHADDLKTIIGVVASDSASRKTKQSLRLIDEIFEELVGRPYNQIRHHGQKLEVRICQNRQFVLYGYFVAGPRADGTMSASRAAHGTTGTHWSFPVSIRRFLGLLIRGARTVDAALPAAIRASKNELWGDANAASLSEIFAWVNRCPAFCFPNESAVIVPYVAVRDGVYLVALNSLTRLKSVALMGQVTWTASFTGDGKSTKFAVE
jgi:hypothetical protein